MYMKIFFLLNILFISCSYGNSKKYTKNLYINSHINKWKLFNLVKKYISKCKSTYTSKINTLENEFGMNLKILKTNERKVVENLKKRGMEKCINIIKILKNIIDEKNKLESINNTLRNKRKSLSDEIRNLIFTKKHPASKEITNDEKSYELKKECSEFYSQEDSYKKNEKGESNRSVTEYRDLKNIDKNKNIDLQMNDYEKKMVYIKNEINEINNNISVNETKLSNLKLKIENYLNKIPNILLPDVSDGKTCNSNKIIKTYKIKNIETNKENSFIESHDNIIKKYDNQFIFSDISNKIGFGYNILVNNIAKLERALIDFMINTHVNKFKYTYVKAPVIVAKSALTNTGQLPKFEKDLFKINNNYKILNEEAYLIPTSEVSLLNLFRNSLLDYDKLPIKLVSHSSCFRIEKNCTYGKSSKGLLREHIFEKVELISITDKYTSLNCYKDLIKHCEYILKKLKIPYRLVLLNSVETPFSSSICYDLEAWLPSQKRFIEVSSCSNCLDFQSRKLNLKFKKNDKNFFCHTINGSGLAVGRILAIILEQYQIQKKEENNKIQLIIPKPLRKYMNASTITL